MPSSLTTGLTMRLAPRPAPTHADAPSANVERWRGIVAPRHPHKDTFNPQKAQRQIRMPAFPEREAQIPALHNVYR